ncbi:MAG: addiction module protein [Xanthomonadales bacterium]|nr:addiction module protein [Xanthomonadales bacterium]
MKSAAQVEDDLMNLPPAERAHLAMVAWASLEGDAVFAASAGFDHEGVALATERDAQMSAGTVETLSHNEFIERTGGGRR